MLYLGKTIHRYLPNSDTHQLSVSKPQTQQQLKLHIRKTLLQTFTYIISCEDGECLVEGHELFGFLQSLYVFFSGLCRGGDILIFKGPKATSKALPFVKLLDRSFGLHLPKIVR